SGPDTRTPASSDAGGHRSPGELDLLGGPAAAAAGALLRDAAVGDDGHGLQVGKPPAQRALPVHPDRLRVPAGDRLLAADVAGAGHGTRRSPITKRPARRAGAIGIVAR